MATRLRDLLIAGAALILLSPVLLAAALAVRLSDPGPVLYRARRVGRGGRVFSMLKFRTMRRDHRGPAITAAGDARVFPAGRVLRRCKVDELPQLINILRGQMSLVGPRPEDPSIVQRCYRPWQMETLAVLPGLASPGSLYNYTHGEAMLEGADAEAVYAERLLPLKLALDCVYVRRRSAVYDLRVIWRTALTLLAISAGRTAFPPPPEMGEAEALLAGLEAPAS